jgi:hypothetical protein
MADDLRAVRHVTALATGDSAAIAAKNNNPNWMHYYLIITS